MFKPAESFGWMNCCPFIRVNMADIFIEHRTSSEGTGTNLNGPEHDRLPAAPISVLFQAGRRR